MRLELKDIKDGCLQQDMECSSGDFPILVEMSKADELAVNVPIRFQLRFQKSGQLIEVDGSFATEVSLSCGRCLQPYEKSLASEFAFTFTPLVEETYEAEEEVELETDELGLVYYKDDILELQQPLQDQLVMALPISPLCGDECQGLCPECGANMNLEQCNCEKKVFNNKFSALAGLKIDSSE